jgi:hypothetical protein
MAFNVYQPATKVKWNFAFAVIPQIGGKRSADILSAGRRPNVTNFWAMDFSRLQIETGLVITDKLKI